MNTRLSSKLIAVLAFAVAMAFAPAAIAAAPPPMTVVLHQKSGLPISYFELQARPGRHVAVGSLELRNRGGRLVTVLLDPIDAVTATTLGSAYDVRGLSIHGPSRWTHLSRRRVVLAPHGTTNVAVAVLAPAEARPGDYLSGIGVQALAGPQQTKVRANVAISSTQRYAVGLEVRLPGPRTPVIGLTGATIARDPAGITFALRARNGGNVILQNVRGSALITQGRRIVAHVSMGPGTFVTGTSIAYPIPTPREQPPQGTVYRVRALLRYPGGIAQLDTLVRFGRRDALRQQSFGGPKAPSQSSGFPILPVAMVIALAALLAVGSAILWRRNAGTRSPIRTLDRVLAAAQSSGDPMSLILVGAELNAAASRRLARLVRARLRRSDRLCRLDGQGFLVVAPQTDAETADALAADLRRQLDRTHGSLQTVAIEVHAAETTATAAQLLGSVTTSSRRVPEALPAS